ncbi:hypothetical protein, partial [Stenotrophomonas sp. HMWF003]|uniref:hypothetical protein n=1 Tax=Stenotrophomonas sp. HMWF003 TaxID=2056840 RepID=UPI002159FA40
QGGYAGLDDSADTDLQLAEIDADALTVVEPVALEIDAVEAETGQALDADAPVVDELTVSNDLSAYFDADLPVNAAPIARNETTLDAQPDAGSADPGGADVATFDAVQHDVAAHAQDGLETVELTGADDLSRFLDADVTPVAEANDVAAATGAAADDTLIDHAVLDDEPAVA